jgi:uncharacterized Zn-finger protein
MVGSNPGHDGEKHDLAHAKSALMTPFETIEIDEMRTACDGGGGPLGHPKVYLSLAPAGRVECPYCSRLFVNRAVFRTGGEAPTESPAERSRA